jgi:phospholipase C
MKIFIAVLLVLAAGFNAFAIDCSQKAGSLPYPAKSKGANDSQIPIDHIIVIMQENHSFDAYFGRLNQPQYYGSAIDGVTDDMYNLDKSGNPVHAYHETNLCIADVDHTWNAMHVSWDNGKNDGFVSYNGERTMAYYDQTDIPYYYELANQFAVADRYFCSLLSQTYPNRFFLLTGTAFGHVYNDSEVGGFKQRTIFDNLTENNVSWGYYTDSPGYLQLFGPMWEKNKKKMFTYADFKKHLDDNTLPQVVFIDAEFDTVDEHPDADVQIGQQWVAQTIRDLMNSSSWKNSALFLTYDENGGFYDHVPPPEACLPDDIPPIFSPELIPGTYDRLGFRVPFVLVSPYAKRHYVSHVTYDHTSILKFIETKFNLPALTNRDANADSMLDLFDFENPNFSIPNLPSGDPDPARECHPDEGEVRIRG